MLPQQYCLRWRYHHSNLQTMFSQLLEREAFCDVTLACEGRTIKAHKIVLSACSTYFDTILSQYEEKDPILIMKDVKYVDIKCLVEFMYKGEINVDHCHLATLLKTAEELRIKGLAEVSWRDDDGSEGVNGVQSALPHVSTVMGSPKREMPVKRKRGRPPIDDYDQSYVPHKVAHTEEGFSNDAVSSSDHQPSAWDDSAQVADETGNKLDKCDDSPMKIKFETEDELVIDEFADMSSLEMKQEMMGAQNRSFNKSMNTSSCLTAAIEQEWPDVIKMNDYLSTGRRQQFWEEPFTKRVMDAIKTKNLEMKIAAELLGVSYGTLYGRYRDAYGCLKHPYRVRDFWSEQGPTDILLKLKRKEITLFRAAEQLNVTPQTLSNYLISMSQLDSEASGLQHPAYDEGVESEEDQSDSILPDFPANAGAAVKNVVKNFNSTPTTSGVAAGSSSAGSGVLPNHPDLTIIKKEKLLSILGKMNSNLDHSTSAGSSTFTSDQVPK